MMKDGNKFVILVVVGTRPEAIKMSPLILELKKNERIHTVVCLTGQHKEMLDSVIETFNISIDYNLSIMRAGQSLNMITTSVLSGMDKVLDKEQPDMVLVHGDTATSFAASLAAFYRKIPVGHIEAGLRTYNMNSPFPEEFNRQAVDIIASLYFAPTQLAKDNLLREGKKDENILVTGNTVIDALKTTVNEDYSDHYLEWAKDSKLILMTAHRRENIGAPMHNIFRAVRRIVDDNPDVKVIYPIHKNPSVRSIADMHLADQERIKMIEPLDVMKFHNYIKKSYLIMTDSGGIQEEAPSLGKPVLVLRDTTERPEGVLAGTLKLVGTSEEVIYEETQELLHNFEKYGLMSKAQNPYGDGHASKRIVQGIIDFLIAEKGL